MGSRSVSVELAPDLEYSWSAGVVAGLVAGVGMGVVFHVVNLMPFVGALYGWPSVLGGWVVHLVNSTGAGLVFAFLVTRPVVRQQTVTVAETVAAGVVYAAAIGLVSTGVLLPLSMNYLGVQSFPDPLVPLPAALGNAVVFVAVGVGHLLYGLLLGSTYGAVRGHATA